MEPPDAFAMALRDGESRACECTTNTNTGRWLAAFAIGCLGLDTPAKGGNKLGLMGSVSYEELLGVLRHLETLAWRRALKLSSAAEGAIATGGAGTIGTDTGLSAAFEKALLAAVQTESLMQMYEQLPKDARCRADLCVIFEMEPAGTSTASGVSFPVSAEFTEFAKDLPCPTAEMCAEAQRCLVSDGDGGDKWELQASAINVLRASNLALAETTSPGEASAKLVTPELLTALAKCCGSRRPALAKAALCALAELAPSCNGKEAEAEAWQEAADGLLDACFVALKSTKVVARFAEQALGPLADCLAACLGPCPTAAKLNDCILRAAKAKPTRPHVAVAACRLLCPLVPRLATDGDEAAGGARVLEDMKAAAEAVLAARNCGTAFGAARALLQALPAAPGKAEEATMDPASTCPG